MNKSVVILVIVVLVSLFGFVFYSNKKTALESSLSADSIPSKTSETLAMPSTNIQASFAIFTNGTFRVFTAVMYHNLSNDVYIQADKPNVVLVKKSGITWDDFFKTLPFMLTSDCLTTGTKETFCTGSSGTLKFYLNGERRESVLNQEIKNGDKLLVTFGNESDDAIKLQVDKIPQ